MTSTIELSVQELKRILAHYFSEREGTEVKPNDVSLDIVRYLEGFGMHESDAQKISCKVKIKKDNI